MFCAPVNVPVNVPVVQTASLVLELCVVPKSAIEIATFLGFKDKRSVRRILNPLIEEGRIAMTIPDKPNSRFQKYISIK